MLDLTKSPQIESEVSFSAYDAVNNMFIKPVQYASSLIFRPFRLLSDAIYGKSQTTLMEEKKAEYERKMQILWREYHSRFAEKKEAVLSMIEEMRVEYPDDGDVLWMWAMAKSDVNYHIDNTDSYQGFLLAFEKNPKNIFPLIDYAENVRFRAKEKAIELFEKVLSIIGNKKFYEYTNWPIARSLSVNQIYYSLAKLHEDLKQFDKAQEYYLYAKSVFPKKIVPEKIYNEYEAGIERCEKEIRKQEKQKNKKNVKNPRVTTQERFNFVGLNGVSYEEKYKKILENAHGFLKKPPEVFYHELPKIAKEHASNLDEYLHYYPDDPAAQCLRAEFFIEAEKDYDGFIHKLHEVAKQYPEHPLAFMALRKRTFSPEKEIEYLNGAIKAFGQNAYYTVNYGSTKIELSKAAAHRYRAAAHEMMGNYKAALEDYLQSRDAFDYDQFDENLYQSKVKNCREKINQQKVANQVQNNGAVDRFLNSLSKAAANVVNDHHSAPDVIGALMNTNGGSVPTGSVLSDGVCPAYSNGSLPSGASNHHAIAKSAMR